MTRLLARLLRRSIPPALSHGNALDIHTDGDACFEALWADLDAAGQSIWMETYILDPDAIGLETLARLRAAAARGCEVILVYDAVGSGSLGERHLEALHAAGARVHAFNPLLRNPLRRAHAHDHGQAPRPWLFRDHRKLTLIDGRIGWLGGRNIGEHYAGERLGCPGAFRDTQVRVRGPAVADLAMAFQETLDELHAAQPPLPPTSPAAGTASVEVLRGNGLRDRRELQVRIRQAVLAARESVLITTPYPLLSRRLLRTLRRRVTDGIEVRMLIPEHSDVYAVDLARTRLIRQLVRQGVRVYRYRRPMHTKTLVVDDAFALVGSFNLDIWGSAHNLEIGLAIHDTGAAARLAADFRADLTDALSDPPPPSPLPRRALEWLAQRALRIGLLHATRPGREGAGN